MKRATQSRVIKVRLRRQADVVKPSGPFGNTESPSLEDSLRAMEFSRNFNILCHIICLCRTTPTKRPDTWNADSRSRSARSRGVCLSEYEAHRKQRPALPPAEDVCWRFADARDTTMGYSSDVFHPDTSDPGCSWLVSPINPLTAAIPLH